MLIELKQHTLIPPFRANARLSPGGGKLLNSRQLQSCPLLGEGCPVDRKGAFKQYFLIIAELTR